MKTVALFDFCETIVKTQTVGQFCRYYLKEGLSFSPQKIFLYRLINLYRTTLKKNSIWFNFFDGLNISELDQYAEKYASHLYTNFLIREIEERIKWHIAQNHLVVVVSAGLACYINITAKKLGIKHVIAADFIRENQRIRGKIDKNSYCYGEQKVERLHNYLNVLGEQEIDWENSHAYSDHPSDIPLLNLVGNRFIVAKKGKEIPFSKAYLSTKEINLIQYE